MEEREGNWLGSSIAWPSIFVVLLIVVGFSVRPPRIDSPRPQQVSPLYPNDSSIHARLWEDPLEAINIIRESTVYSQSIAKATSENYADCSNFLFVFVTGRPYSIDRERRLRDRYAVLSALARYDYVPESNEQIQWIALDKIAQTNIKESSLTITQDVIVPYEKFYPANNSSSQNKKVCVFWLNDEYFKKESMLSGLAWIYNIFYSPTCSIKIIGPIDSTRLVKMMHEAKNWKNFGSKFLKLVEIYSPRATISYQSNEKSFSDILDGVSDEIKLIRTIGTDKKLMDSLVSELRLRQSDPAVRSNGIVLVSEWDTDYGRAFPSLFIEAASYENNEPKNIKKFQYFKGIDGELPRPKGSEDASDKKEESEQKGFRSFPKPEGKPQLDYLYRLVDSINQIKYNWGSIKLKAIGILGSDIYDKLLILRTLREHFPEALFFTTDLDALYMHPSEREWTQNLIVSSFFGLRLKDTYQDSIPPFRDVYQTSVFYSCLYALKDISSTTLTFYDSPQFNPCIYEIGRSDAYDLTGPTRVDSVKDDLRPESQRNQSWIQQPFHYITLMFALVFFLWILYFYYNPWRNYVLSVMNLERQNIFVSIISGIIFFIVFILIYKSHQLPNEEPFTLYEGISIWPTELIRLFIFFYCLYSIAKGYDNIKKCQNLILIRKGITKDLMRECLAKKDDDQGVSSISPQTKRDQYNHIEPPHQNDPSSFLDTPFCIFIRKVIKKIANFISKISKIKEDFLLTSFRYFSPAWNFKMKEEDINKVIDSLKRRDKSLGLKRIGTYIKLLNYSLARFRAIRVVSLAILFILFAFCIFLNYSFPISPLRGYYSWWGDSITIGFCVSSLILLLLFVMDSTKICELFVSDLSCGENTTDSISYDKCAEEEWEKIEDIETITGKVSHLIYNPFIALFLMILSRYKIFDRWDWPISLIIVMSVFFLGTIFLSINLRRIVETARSQSTKTLDNILIECRKNIVDASKKQEIEEYKSTIDLVELIRQRILTLNTGAFASFTQNPVLRAILIPFGGIGTLNLLEFLIKY